MKNNDKKTSKIIYLIELHKSWNINKTSSMIIKLYIYLNYKYKK